MKNWDYWQQLPFWIENHRGITVIREDFMEGGTKMRFLPFLCKEFRSIVYASPFCGAAQVALSVVGKELGKQVHIFSAARKVLHRNQLVARENGATLHAVPTGYLSNCTAKARAYAASLPAAVCLPLGFRDGAAMQLYQGALIRLRDQLGPAPDELWVAAGSGMVAINLALCFPQTKIVAVMVGKGIDVGLQTPKNLAFIRHYLKFEKDTQHEAPFPSNANYDRKAWELLVQWAQLREARGKRLAFFNVAG